MQRQPHPHETTCLISPVDTRPLAYVSEASVPPAPMARRHPSVRPPQDLVAAIVVPNRRYPLGFGLNPRLGHCVLLVSSAASRACHTFEWGLYARRDGKRTGAVRSFAMPTPRWGADGRVRPEAFAEVLRTVSGMQHNQSLRGQYYQLPPGGARPALELVRRWRSSAPRYHFLWCSCMHFVSSVMMALGDASAFPPTASIRAWPGSRLAPRFTYDARTHQLAFQAALADRGQHARPLPAQVTRAWEP